MHSLDEMSFILKSALVMTAKICSRCGLVNATLCQLLLDMLVDLFRARDGFDLDDTSLLLEIFHDGHGGINESFEAFLDALNVVVSSARCFPSVQQSILHDFFGAVEEEREFGRNDNFLELDSLVHLAWETCNVHVSRDIESV